MEKWFLLNKHENYNRIKNNKAFSNFQKILLANRNIIDDYKLSTFINTDLENLHDNKILKDMKKGVDILVQSIRNNENILIVGDYDQDGVAATVILYKAIKSIYENITYAIPDRIEDGYGLNSNIVDKAYEDDINLIITCDNGIAAFEAVDHAIDLGINVIVTDHHEIVYKDGVEILPNANAVINPHRKDDESSFKIICGAMVAFKFVQSLYDYYGDILGLRKNDIDDLCQFAALGTISDMMPIIDENRIIVINGLKVLNKRQNKGLDILLNYMQWNKEITIYTVGFLIGPTINSSGRIYSAKLGVELLLEEDISILHQYAKTLVELNEERKRLTKEAVELAELKVNDENLHNNDIIIVYDNNIHESICGLVAGRIKDRYNKPTIVLTDSSKEGIVKGSGRSIDTYNIFESLNNFRDMFVTFGGHAKACGLSLEKTNIQELNKLLNESSNLSDDDFKKEIEIDCSLKFEDISMNLVNEIFELEPFGYEFPSPVFATKSAKILNASIIGKNKNVLKLTLDDNTGRMQAISFNAENIINIFKEKYNLDIENIRNFENKIIDIVYKLEINEFNGMKNIQLNIVSMR